MRRIASYFLTLLLLLLVVNCAKRGTPTGGDKDTTAPELTKAQPALLSTNYKNERIRLYFDEYVVLKDLQKQLIISPPIDAGGYIISPQGGASKYIEIKIKDTLQEKTTYTFNFGQSIQDNNEGNPYKFFQYVFSTGDYIDSLKVSGVIKDAVQKYPDQFVSIMLYEVDENYTDSIIYKEKPTYITNTLDSTVNFHIENLRAGKYKMVAIKDEASNYIFNQKADKIGFVEQTITIPTDSVYEIALFKEEVDFEIGRPSIITRNRIAFAYQGDPTGMNIKLLTPKPEGYRSTITKDKEKDSLNYWFTETKLDSLQFEISKGVQKKEVTVRLRSLPSDSLVFNTTAKGSLDPGEKFALTSNIPLVKKDDKMIRIMDRDSTVIPFKTTLNTEENQLEFDFETVPKQRYKFQLLPNAIEDFYGNTNDTLNLSISTKGLADYGNIVVTANNISRYPILMQLTDEQGEIIKEIYAIEARPTYNFDALNPGKYFIRLIYDDNKNQIWDTGNYLKKLQPEQVFYLPGGLIDLRANWDRNENFTLPE